MAEGALFNVAEGIIGQLAKLALKEIALLWGLKDELKTLENTVSTIKAVVQDAEERQAQSHAIKDWVAKLKDVLFEADDLLDDFSTEVLRQEVMTRNKKAKKVRIFFSKSNQLAYGRNMGHKIKAIREKLNAIAEDRNKFHLEERPRETQVTNPIRETDYFVSAETVIGRELDKKVILERLLDSNIEEIVSVYSIVGIGGLGKTTLAQLVFNDEEIKKEFERKFWVCVSDDFDVNIIVKKILEYAKGKKLENLERNASINDLQKEIDGKRFLLVLDDVWNYDLEKWDRLKEILLGGARGSRILVSTREEKVAESSKTIETHRLTGLNDEDSWSLFKQKAFKKGQEPENSKFKEIGMEIISKCKGVPLAIKTIGSLLYTKNSEEEWLSFKNNEFSEVNETKIQPILRLSYDHLPSYLKQCFAYCSLFPKDYEIEKERLVKLWMAQGFIRLSGQNQCLEDVGHAYFMELFRRSFFQEDTRSRFKIHDLMHDLAILVAGLESTAFEINGKNIDEKTHHVSFGFDLDSSKQIPTSLVKASRIRTFLLPCQTWDSNRMIWNKSNCDAFVSSFKFLRLLDLNRTNIRSVPHSVGKLKHLRHLDLSLNEIKTLPNSITRLQNLEILNLYFCNKLIELPRNISRLVNLRHLIIKACNSLTHMPRGLGQLTNLQSLDAYVLSTDSKSGSGLKELHGLNQLRKNLRIKNLRHKKDAELECKSCLKEKQHLEGLVLEWIEREGDVEYDEMSVKALEPNQNLKSLKLKAYRGVKYPSWLSVLKNLVSLKLFSMKNSQDVLPLHQFPSLKTLHLADAPSLEYVSLVSKSFIIPPLESLEIMNCPNLKGWWKRRSDSIEEDEDDADNYSEISTITVKNHSLLSFARLSNLDISGCHKLSSMPLFPYLERLYLRYSNLRPLERTISMGMISTTSQENPTAAAVAESTSSAPCSSSSTLAASFTPLSKLKSLDIRMREDSDGHVIQSIRLSNNGDGMKLEWQGNIYTTSPQHLQILKPATSLQHLQIQDCSSLTTLPERICEIISLQSLDIGECPKFTSLPALPSLQSLNISNCLNFTSLPALPSLQSLDISSCPNFTSLPALPSLQSLCITNCPNFTSLPALPSLQSLCIYDGPNFTSLPALPSLQSLRISHFPNFTSLPALTSLQSLHFWDCPNFTSLPALTSLQSLYISDCPNNFTSLPALTSLQSLKIWDCPNFTSLPALTSLQSLHISNCPNFTCPNFTSLPALTSLQSLHISNCPNFTSLPALTSLQSLYISDCPNNFTSLPALTSLQSLHISNCPNFTSLPALTSLQSLYISDCPNNFTSLPALTSLQSLHISNCPNFTSLPALRPLQSLHISDCPNNFTSLPALTSLQSLEIWDCPNFTSLPALTSLKTLDIKSCPILVESCKNQDWVARIENLRGDLGIEFARIENLRGDLEQTETNDEYELKTRGFTKIFGRCSGSTSQ